MITIATIRPEEPCELTFDLNVSGSKEAPSDIRFIIEGTDEFSIMCKCIRDADSIKVFIPRLLNLFRGGTYRAKLEVILENRLFVPLNEEIIVESPVTVQVPIKKQLPEQVQIQEIKPEIKVSLSQVIQDILDLPKTEVIKEVTEEKKEIVEPIVMPKVDKDYKTSGFKGIRNPFKKG